MIDHELHLRYALAEGWLEPFTSGLRGGTAMARRCQACDRVSFVPLRACDCGEANGTWIELTGMATVEMRTTGADGDFGLVRFDGAATRTVARLIDFGPDASRGQLLPAPGPLPAVTLRPLSNEAVA